MLKFDQQAMPRGAAPFATELRPSKARALSTSVMFVEGIKRVDAVLETNRCVLLKRRDCPNFVVCCVSLAFVATLTGLQGTLAVAGSRLAS